MLPILFLVIVSVAFGRVNRAALPRKPVAVVAEKWPRRRALWAKRWLQQRAGMLARIG